MTLTHTYAAYKLYTRGVAKFNQSIIRNFYSASILSVAEFNGACLSVSLKPLVLKRIARVVIVESQYCQLAMGERPN